MEKIEKGTIVEVNLPNVEKPIKAVVLDIIPISIFKEDFSEITHYTYILYAQKRLFKMSNECQQDICTSITEDGRPIDKIYWSDFIYDGIIVDYCEIPEMSSDL